MIFTNHAFQSQHNLLSTGDYGEYVNNVYRVLKGDLPYRDFWLLFPPGEVYLPAFFVKLFGDRLDIIPFFFAAVKILASLLGFQLARKLGNNITAIITAVLIYTNIITLINIYIIPLLIACLLIFEHFDAKIDDSRVIEQLATPKKQSLSIALAIAGCFIALAFSIRFELASVFFVAVVITLLADRYLLKNYARNYARADLATTSEPDHRHYQCLNSGLPDFKNIAPQNIAPQNIKQAGKSPQLLQIEQSELLNECNRSQRLERSHSCLSDILALSSGFGLTLAIMAIACFSFFKAMLPAIFIDAIQHGTSLNLPYFYNVVAVKPPIDINLASGIAYLNWIVPKLTLYSFPFLVAISVAFVLYQNYLTRTAVNKVLLLIGWICLSFPRCLGRSDFGYLTYVLFPLLVLAPFLVMVIWQKWRSLPYIYIPDVDQTRCQTKNAQDLDSPRRHQARLAFWYQRMLLVIGLPLAILLVYNLPRLLISTNRQVTQISAPAGQFMLRQGEAEFVQRVIQEIETYTQPGEPIFVIPFTFPFYGLSQRSNPTYYDSLIDLYARPTAQKQERICSELAAAKPKLIVHDAVEKLSFGDRHTHLLADVLPILDQCIQANYTKLHTYGSLATYVRRQ
ncbi:hypothetical protein [Thalassoporum mexicanum]|uniref:hypothetical protein n=1 Tax=Thalassoporum mexicanum TaxID=3457544 RepID=UPI0002FAF3EB|nr:hypothetical protein [Pseudanabaena sp. PCC 7367]